MMEIVYVSAFSRLYFKTLKYHMMIFYSKLAYSVASGKAEMTLGCPR